MQYHELHKELWLWLAENPKKNKEDWFKFKGIKGVLGECYACQFVKDKYSYSNCLECGKCPIYWGSDRGRFNCQSISTTIFSRWDNEEHDMVFRSKLALQIANKKWDKNRG